MRCHNFLTCHTLVIKKSVRGHCLAHPFACFGKAGGGVGEKLLHNQCGAIVQALIPKIDFGKLICY